MHQRVAEGEEAAIRGAGHDASRDEVVDRRQDRLGRDLGDVGDELVVERISRHGGSRRDLPGGGRQQLEVVRDRRDDARRQRTVGILRHARELDEEERVPRRPLADPPSASLVADGAQERQRRVGRERLELHDAPAGATSQGLEQLCRQR